MVGEHTCILLIILNLLNCVLWSKIRLFWWKSHFGKFFLLLLLMRIFYMWQLDPTADCGIPLVYILADFWLVVLWLAKRQVLKSTSNTVDVLFSLWVVPVFGLCILRQWFGGYTFRIIIPALLLILLKNYVSSLFLKIFFAVNLINQVLI